MLKWRKYYLPDLTMQVVSNQRPNILCIGGLDPSGGAGLQADIEAIAYCGGHALAIATCLTVQNSHKAYSVNAVDHEVIQQQAKFLLEDIKVSACKIGVIPNPDIALVISSILEQLTEVPIVLDPVLSASHGASFVDAATLNIIRDRILPNVTVITPNHAELNQLTEGDQSIMDLAVKLCQSGPDYALVTGADAATVNIENIFVSAQGIINRYKYERLPHSYHGSGCTMSSALACYLTRSQAISKAVKQAQDYTMQTLINADMPGRGQHIPRRVIQ